MTRKAISLKDYRPEISKTDWTGESIFRSFFPGKFSSPRIDPDFHLYRGKTIEPIVNATQNVISIEARAGQGKSIIAAQFLQRIRADYAWLQLDSKDRDPVIFVAAILAALLKSFPDLNRSIIFQMTVNREVIAQESDRLAPTLAKDLAAFIKEEFYFVIDDLHLLKDSQGSLSFLKSIIANAPPKLRFILISRNSQEIDAICSNTLHLDNTCLALSHGDVAELFARIFKTPLPAKIITELHRSTEGWIMGLILASHAYTNNFDSRAPLRLKNLVAARPAKFWDYFHTEILTSLSQTQRHNLLCLALLDDIPLNLAESLDLGPDISEFLEYLVRKNFFLRRLEAAQPSYCFHHLFQEFLRSRADAELSQNEQLIILAKSGHWHLRQDRYEHALQYYLKARVYGMAEKILRNVGLMLRGDNRTIFSNEILRLIPSETIKGNAWFSLITAGFYSNIDPPQSKEYLDLAHQKFISQNDEMGELLTLAGLMTYHIGVDCNFKVGEKLLPRAEALYATFEDQFSVAARIQIASVISYGLCYFVGQFERAAQYIEKVIHMAKERGLYDAMALGVMAQGLICSFDGNWQKFKNLIEKSFFLLQSPRVSNINKLGMAALQLNSLAYEGDLVTCNYYRQLIDFLVDPQLLSKTFFGASLVTLDANIAISESRWETAKACLQKGLDTSGSYQSAHMQSIYWGRYAFIHALQNNSKKALKAVEKSSQLREQVGGTFYAICNNLNTASIHALLGNYKIAEDLLTKIIKNVKSIGPSSIILSAHAHRAFALLKDGRTADGLEDLRKFIRLLKQYNYPYFHNYSATIMQELLTTAMVNDIESEDALWIGKKYLRLVISPAGNHVPLLQINTLGRLEIKIEETARITFGDLTKNQRELLALLISSSPGKGVPHSNIREAFWPESSAEKMRSKLDNLFSRLRKVFNTLLAPYSANNYLSTEKGFIRLLNCQIDANIFENDVRQGGRHMKKQEFSQAGNAFLRALNLYAGEFMPGVYLNDPAAYFREDLQNSFIEASLCLARILSGTGRDMEAIQVCQKAILCDPSNEPMVKMLFDLFTRNNDTVQAKKTLTNYHKALEDDGFSIQEIEDIIETIGD